MTVLRFFIPYSNHKGCGPKELTLYGMAVIKMVFFNSIRIHNKSKLMLKI